MQKGKRRTFTAEFKAEAIKLVIERGMSVGAAALDLGLSDSCLRKWVKQARIDTKDDPGGALTTDERKEMQRLRREVRTLRMEREILKKATAFFAKENG
jgi:transposase-like protein